MNAGNGMTQIQRNVVIVKTLQDISRQSRRVWHDLQYRLHVRAFERQPARHNHADISGAEDHDLPPRHPVIQIHVRLRGSGGKDACRPLSGYAKSAAGPFLAAHSQNDSLGLICTQSLSCNCLHKAVLRKTRDRRAGFIRDSEFFHFINKNPRVLRTGQAFPETSEPESVMNTLTQNTARFLLPFQNDNVTDTLFIQLNSRRKSGRACADDDSILADQLCISTKFLFSDHFRSPSA